MFDARSRLGAVINDQYARDVYGSYPGSSLGIYATSPSGYAISNGGDSMYAVPNAGRSGGEADAAAAANTGGNPVAWWVALLIGLVILMYGSRHLGGEGETFGHIRPGVYNILVISWAAVLGLVFWKVLFARFKVPGLSTLVMSA